MLFRSTACACDVYLDSDIRQSAIIALGGMWDREVVKAVGELIDDRDQKVRERVVEFLAEAREAREKAGLE